jgi:hypothetical protein
VFEYLGKKQRLIFAAAHRECPEGDAGCGVVGGTREAAGPANKLAGGGVSRAGSSKVGSDRHALLCYIWAGGRMKGALRAGIVYLEVVRGWRAYAMWSGVE